MTHGLEWPNPEILSLLWMTVRGSVAHFEQPIKLKVKIYILLFACKISLILFKSETTYSVSRPYCGDHVSLPSRAWHSSKQNYVLYSLTKVNTKGNAWLLIFKSQARAQECKMYLKRGNKMSGPRRPQRTSLQLSVLQRWWSVDSREKIDPHTIKQYPQAVQKARSGIRHRAGEARALRRQL